MDFEIRRNAPADRDWIIEIIRGWGADFIVSRGRKIYPADIEGFHAVADDGEKVGLVTYEIVGDQCEVVTLDAMCKFSGVGTALMRKVVEQARAAGCRRLWLITLNDNLDAIRFYQRRGMTIAAVHVNSMEVSRRMKPVIPRVGQYGIPVRDEIEFEMAL